MISHSHSSSSLSMPNVSRRHTVAPLLLGSLLLGSLLAPTAAALGTVEVAAAFTGRAITSLQEDDVPEVVFAELKFEDAMSRAERTKTMLVVLWVKGEDTAATTAFRDGIFQDKAVRRWLAASATVVRIDADVDKAGARGNSLSTYPAVDMLDLARGGRIERLVRGSTAIDFLAAVYGAENDATPLDKPTGVEATEPFRWLAWANARYRAGDVAAARDAVDGYTWCLRRADEHRPDFRARYLEFLLKRIAGAKMREPLAIDVLNAERGMLASRMRRGLATRRDVYDLTRVDFWRRKELDTRDLYIELGRTEGPQNRHRAGLFDVVVPILGRFQQYDEILQCVGAAPVDMFRTRVEALAVEAEPADEAGDGASDGSDDGASPADGPLRYTVPDTRGDIIDDASWVYEALLAAGRGADARDLLAYMSETYPLPRTYGLFMEGALRLQLWSLAAEIADTGMSVVDERGQNRLRRLLGRIPVDDGDL